LSSTLPMQFLHSWKLQLAQRWMTLVLCLEQLSHFAVWIEIGIHLSCSLFTGLKGPVGVLLGSCPKYDGGHSSPRYDGRSLWSSYDGGAAQAVGLAVGFTSFEKFGLRVASTPENFRFGNRGSSCGMLDLLLAMLRLIQCAFAQIQNLAEIFSQSNACQVMLVLWELSHTNLPSLFQESKQVSSALTVAVIFVVAYPLFCGWTGRWVIISSTWVWVLHEYGEEIGLTV
jgi:hypothetical protein